MNLFRFPRYLLILLLPAGLACLPALSAQEKPAPAPATANTPAISPAGQKEAAGPVAAPSDSKTPAKAPAVAAPAAVAQPEVVAGKSAAAESPAESSTDHGRRHHGVRSRGDQGNDRVTFGGNSTLAEGEKADSVVSIAGSSTSAGEVGDSVVSIIGNSRVTGGSVGDTVVSVLGSTHINGHVGGQVVAVLGNVELGPKAVVDGGLVCIGGHVTRDPAAIVTGSTQNIGIAGHFINFDGFVTWLSQCLLYARPLAFDAQLWWAWCIAFVFLGFYLVIALLAPAAVTKCAETLEQRPGHSLLSALLTLLLTPVAYILLLLTLAIAIGFVLIPLFTLGLFFAAIFGKIVMLAWLGRRFTKLLGDGPLSHPAVGVLIGGLIMLGLYTIPVVGFIVYKLAGVLGLGVVVYTLILQYKASRPAKPVPPVAAAVLAAPAAAVPVAPDAAVAAPGIIPAAPVALPPVISSATLPRAGFWIRVGASLLDAVMVGIAFGMLHRMLFGLGGVFPFWFSVYCVVMWATKGTTIGGVICGLKVVRLDDRPLDWGVSIVRSLGAFLSLAVAGIGFIWVAFDDHKQSWHDKIAGTTIVIVPKGTALL